MKPTAKPLFAPKQRAEFVLFPTNEGQILNFMEDFTGTFQEAIKRAEEIISGLSRLLPKGSFGCFIEHDGKEIKFIQ